MERGTYTAASGGLLQFRKLDVVANNLANVDTPGFKRQLLVGQTQTFDETLAKAFADKDPYAKGDHDRSPSVSHIQTVTDFSLGPIKSTGNPLDVALRHPNDFLVINTPEGPQYTRAGNLSLNGEGTLVTADGFEVQGDGGPIAAVNGQVSISQNGAVRSRGEEVGRIQVVRIDEPEKLERIGSSRFKLAVGQGQPPAVEADIAPASLEMSNVSAITGMIDMITANRAFEMYTKAAQSIDGLNERSISQIGRTR